MPEDHKESKLSQEELADLKAQLLESVYADIGRSIIRKLFFGVCVILLVLDSHTKQKLIDLFSK